MPKLLLATVLLWLAGCGTPGPPVHGPAALPERWQAPLPTLAHGGSAQTLAQWWGGFDDPLLAELVAQAQAGSPTMAQAVARIGQARAALHGAQAQRWPAVAANAQAGRGSSPATGWTATAQAGAAADAQWEVDLFGGTRAAVAAAQARADQASLGWHAARVSLAADVAQALVGLRACEAQRAVLDADAAAQQQIAVLTREKLRVGFESPANAALAEGAAADSGNRAIAQRTDCEVALQALVVLTGQPTTTLRQRLAERSGRLPQPGAFVVASVPAQVLAQRPDIAAAGQALLAAAAEVGVADAARWPRLTFNGSIGVAALRVGGVGSDGSSWGLGPALTLPLFDAGQRAAQQAGARARYDEARAALDARLRSAVAEVEQALLRLDGATRREADAQRAAQGFRDYFAAAQARWRVGAASLIEHEDARRVALAAQGALLAVQHERVASWITLYRVLGGGWSADDGAPARAGN